MIEYDNRLEMMTVDCDNEDCDGWDEFDGSWHECIDAMKNAGWKIKKSGEEWIHLCSMCKNEVQTFDDPAYG